MVALGAMVGLLVLVGGRPAETGLDAARVVPAVDVAEQGVLGLGAVGERRARGADRVRRTSPEHTPDRHGSGDDPSRAFSPERPAMGTQDIARRTGLANSTTQRLVTELVEWERSRVAAKAVTGRCTRWGRWSGALQRSGRSRPVAAVTFPPCLRWAVLRTPKSSAGGGRGSFDRERLLVLPAASVVGVGMQFAVERVRGESQRRENLLDGDRADRLDLDLDRRVSQTVRV